MTLRDRIKAFLGFVLVWLNTPTSKAGIVAIVTAMVGNRLSPEHVDALVTGLMVLGGAVLVAWPDRPKQP